MNTVTTKSHTGNTTTITTYAPTATEQAGLLQAEQTLAFIQTLDTEAYGWDCLRDVVMEQYMDILRDCKFVSIEYVEQSYKEFLQEEADELFESTLTTPVKAESLDQQLEDWFPNNKMPWETQDEDVLNDSCAKPISGYCFANFTTNQVIFGKTFKECAEKTKTTGNVAAANPRLLNMVWNGQRGHTAGWIKQNTKDFLPKYLENSF